jgi:hypothetical protein
VLILGQNFYKKELDKFMDSFYIKVDKCFLDTLVPDVKEKLEKRIQLNPDKTTYIRMCPYCNYIYLIPLNEKKLDYESDLEVCMKCGRSDPFDKINISIKKVRTLKKLLDLNIPNDTDLEKLETRRVLLEQCIVNFATGIEQFLREFYAIWMNLRFVKNEKNLYDKFYKEANNDFLNIGSMKRRFKDLELKDNLGNEIDIKSQLGGDLYSNLNTLLLKRNVIVHNNGLADDMYNSHIDGNNKCKLGKEIPINVDEIEKYFLSVDSFTKIIKNLYDKYCRRDFEENFDTRIRKDENIVQYLLVQCVTDVGTIGCHATATLVKSSSLSGERNA